MIHTRGVKCPLFSVGERVLCFEPDPTKAKVLYDSKILDIEWTRNEAGKRIPEYLVHFNGWNRSWDRWAPEDFVLKLTDENLSLQEQLQNETGGKSKKRRKRKLSEITDIARRKCATSDSISIGSDESVSTDPNGHDESENFESEDEEIADVPIPLPEVLKSKLEDDCYYINCQDLLVKLPCKPSVLTILEDYLQFFAIRHPELEPPPPMSVEPEALQPPPLPHQNFKVCREYLDGLRVLFDFLIEDHLLYEIEKAQFNLFVPKVTIQPKPKEQEITNAEPLPPTLENQATGGDQPPTLIKMELTDALKEEIPERRITRRLAQHSRQESKQKGEETADKKSDDHRSRPVLRHSRRLASHSSHSSPSASPPPIVKEAPEYPLPLVESVTSAVEAIEGTSRTGVTSATNVSAEGIAAATVTSAVEVTSAGNIKMPINARDKTEPVTEEGKKQSCSEKLQPCASLLNMKLLADDATYDGRIPPCKVYGVVHLLRLFVKMPEVIGKMNLPSKKRKPLLKHTELFLRYLSTTGVEQGLFGDGMYVSSRYAMKK